MLGRSHGMSAGIEAAQANEKETLILAYHNALQTVALLNSVLSEVKYDDKKKQLDKILSTREATKRASMELIKQEDDLFHTKAEKYLFLSQLHGIANNSANIASIFSMESLVLSASIKQVLQEIMMDIVAKSKDMNFRDALDTKEIMEKIVHLRRLVFDQQENMSYLLMEKVVDGLQHIIFSLEKLNEF